MNIITANAALTSLKPLILGFTTNEIIHGTMWGIGALIVILMFLEMITIKQEPKPVDDKRDWCKTKEKDKNKKV